MDNPTHVEKIKDPFFRRWPTILAVTGLLGFIALVSWAIIVSRSSDTSLVTPSAGDIRGGDLSATGAVEIFLEGELSPAPKVGFPAPLFTLSDLEGNEVSLADLRGKAVVINFWAAECPPCRAEIPDLQAVYQKYRDQGVEFIGLDLLVYPGENPEGVASYVNRTGLTYMVLLDEDASVSRAYSLTALPTTYFLDRDGIIRDKRFGAMSEKEIEERLLKALGTVSEE